jgi:hypothetical protein
MLGVLCISMGLNLPLLKAKPPEKSHWHYRTLLLHLFQSPSLIIIATLP